MASSSTIPPFFELYIPEEEEEIIQNGVNFLEILPEECIAIIASFTTPADACRLALVSKDMLSASESDAIWKRFLPSDIDLILSRCDEQDASLTKFQSKKQLYKRLIIDCLLVDQSSKSFWLDRSTRKKCWMIGARSLGIALEERPENWKWSPFVGSRFPEAAELVSAWWANDFNMSTTIRTSMLSPRTLYEAYLVYSMTKDAHGFIKPFEALVRIAGDGSTYTKLVYVNDMLPAYGVQGRMPRSRAYGWCEVMIGEFYSYDRGEEGDEVEFSLTLTEALENTRGIIVDGIEFRPAARASLKRSPGCSSLLTLLLRS